MSSRTIFLSRLIGLYCVLVALSYIAQKQAILGSINMLVHYPPALLILGVITLPVGLAMVLGHNIWSRGALPVVITLMGWNTLVKGLLFLLLPPKAFPDLLRAMHYEQLFYFYCSISLVIGLYLTYGGFRPFTKATSRSPRSTSTLDSTSKPATKNMTNERIAS